MGFYETARVVEYFTGQRIHRPKQKVCCPIHEENTPSFIVNEDGGSHCYSIVCDKFWPNEHLLILAKLFGIKERYLPAEHKQAEALRLSLGISVATVLPKIAPKPMPVLSQHVREVTQHILHWAHHTLFNTVNDGLVYWKSRCLPIEANQYVGWVDGKRSTELAHVLHTHAGEEWFEVGVQSGFLSPSGRSVFADRVVMWSMANQLVEYYQARKITPGKSSDKYLSPHAGHGWNNTATIMIHKTWEIHVTEGYLNLLSLYTVGASAACCWGSGKVNILIEKLRPYVNAGRPLIVWVDQDEKGAGEHFYHALANAFEQGDVRYHNPSPYGDPNDILMHHGDLSAFVREPSITLAAVPIAAYW